MGFQTYTPDAGSGGLSGLASLHGIGEAADLAGVPLAFDAGDSFWLATGHRFSKDQIPLAARQRMASANALASASLATFSEEQTAYDCRSLSGSVPPAIIGNIAIFQTRRPGVVLVVDSGGPRTVNTGLLGMVGVVSDGTAFWAFNNGAVLTSDPGTILAATGGIAKSTNGVTWTPQTATGWPAGYILRNALYPFTTGTVASSSAQGYKSFDYATGKQSGIFWCGARFLAVVDDETNFKACRSTNGTAWTDDTTNVLGGTIAASGNIFFYRNGNNCFLKVGTAYRYSADGGANWSNCAVRPTVLNGPGFLQRGASNPAILVATQDNTGIFVSTDSGRTWADRSSAIGTIGSITFGGGVAIIGSNILILTPTELKRSADGGATWAAVTYPNTVHGNPQRVVADAYRAYVTVSNNQILTTTDGITFLVRSASVNTVISSATSLSATVTLFATETDTTHQMAVFTLDGGVTFKGTLKMRYDGSGGNSSCVAVSIGGSGYFVGGVENTNYDQRQFVVSLTDLQDGGSIFMVSDTLNPIRADMTTFIRVA